MTETKEVARELSDMWDKGHNFMKLAEYAMSAEREACAEVAALMPHNSYPEETATAIRARL